MARQLERVERREIDRLMIRMPPRSGKTELSARSFPAYCLGRKPWRQFIVGSASAGLARDIGRDVRNIIASDAYRLIFPVNLSEDSKAANKWNTDEGGAWYSVGVGGDVLGRGAHFWLIDDPFGSMADAQSATIRDNVWKWFNGTVYNRLEPDGAIVIIGHRLHEDDLQGRLEERMRAGGDYDKWEIVELPAIAKEGDPLGRAVGEALWREHFPLDKLERIRANTFARDWLALYQQKPVPEASSSHGNSVGRRGCRDGLLVQARVERRTARSGKDSIDHAPGGHDDVANACAVAIWLASTQRAALRISDEALRLTRPPLFPHQRAF